MTPLAGAPVVPAAQMRAAEAATGDGVSAMMARAGEAVARAVRRLAGAGEVLVLCGPGNNGGDGYVAAACLHAAGVRVRVAAACEPRADAAREARARWTGAVEPLAEARPAAVLVDALFGTGLARPLDASVLHPLERLAARAQLVIAVDLPSGLAGDTGALLDPVPGAAVTLALGAAKPAHLLQPAAARCGAVRLLDIGVPVSSHVAVLAPPTLAAPSPEDHKYSRGMVAVVAGAMPGAAALAATATARVAGYVLLLGSGTDRLPHAIVRRRWSAAALDDPRIGAVVIGPGLGRDEAARAKLDAALATDRPLLLDGDALHLVDAARLRARAAPVVLTPHAGEFARLFGEGEGSRLDRALAAARASGAVTVLKGADTVIAHPDGRARIAAAPAPWLATAGTGDVLAGLAGALLAQRHDGFAAASAAVWLHAEAARRASPAFHADELAAALPAAIAGAL